MPTQLDHIVIGCETLDQGRRFIQKHFGVEIPYGGQHPNMATHNHLMQLGSDIFLELIAIAPQLPAPSRPRWFGLDDPWVRKQVALEPTLLTWVVNTSDIATLGQNAAFDFGVATPMSRGSLNWLFGIPQDGSLFASGLLPFVLQWQDTESPARHMADLGCQLMSLTLYHANFDWLGQLLTSIGANKLVKINPIAPNTLPYWEVEVSTPLGVKRLSSLGS